MSHTRCIYIIYGREERNGESCRRYSQIILEDVSRLRALESLCVLCIGMDIGPPRHGAIVTPVIVVCYLHTHVCVQQAKILLPLL